MRAGVYLRISKDSLGEQLGVERQRQDCRALVEQRGTIVAEYVDNDVSASTGRRRPAYERLLHSVESGEVDTIVAWSLDRLVRRMADLERLVEVCDSRGVSVVLARGSELDLSTPAGKLVARLLGSVARHEVEQKSDRQRREAQQRAERGAATGGRRAFGYSASGMQVDDREAAALRTAYRSLLSGRSLSGIAADLNGGGFTTTMGGPWRHNSLRVTLANPRNAGLRAYRGEVVGPAQWPAIVTEDVWRAACAILAEPARRTNGEGSARKWLGTRLYVCGRCDARMVSTYREKYSDGRRRRIYRCSGCGMSRLAEPVDEFVCAVVAERLSRADVADLLAEPDRDRTEELRREIVALRARRKSLAGLVADGILGDLEVRQEARRLAERIGEVETELARDGKSGALAAIVAAEDPVTAWHATADQVDRRQALVGSLMTVRLLPVHLGRRVFDPETVEVTWKGRAP